LRASTPLVRRHCEAADRLAAGVAGNDSVSQKHVDEFFALLGGAVKEPGG